MAIGMMYKIKARIVGTSLILESWDRKSINTELSSGSTNAVAKDSFQASGIGSGTYGLQENAVAIYTITTVYAPGAEPNTSTYTLDAMLTAAATQITATYPSDLTGISNFSTSAGPSPTID
jgi:hypothetical protein